MGVRLEDVLAYWASATPSAVALRHRGPEGPDGGWVDLSWTALAGRVARTRARLARAGVGPGAHVGLLMENRVEFVEVVLAAFGLGAAVVPLNVRLTPPEIDDLVRRSDCALVVTTAAFLPHAVHLAATGIALMAADDGLPAGAAPWDDPTDAGCPERSHEPGATDLAYICFTSGTTGRPKGAELTQDNLLAAAGKIMLSDHLGRSDRSLLVLPLAFTGSLAVIWSSILLAGGTLVLDDRFDAVRTLATLQDERITVFYGVPFLYAEMSAAPSWAGTDLRGLRVARAAAAPVPEELLARWSARGVALGQGYGLTEGGAANLQLPLGTETERRGWAGLPLLGGAVRVVDEAGLDRPDGAVGELLLRGPEVMRGYYRDPVATAEVLRDGWLHTGDLVVRDAEGYVRIVDRKKDMIITGGLNVYPAEVEDVLSGLPGVVDVAVVGMPDVRWGEQVVAVLVAGADPPSDADVLAHCRARLGDYKVPRRIVVRDELPRTMSGKVRKNDLRAELLPPLLAVPEGSR